jgi:hypothetical protein
MVTRRPFFILTATLLFIAALPWHSEVHSQSHAQTRAVPALAFRPAGSPQGDFSILAPLGWSIEQPPQSLFTMLLKPEPNSSQSIYVIVVSVSDLRYVATLQRCNQQFARNPLAAPDMISGCSGPNARFKPPLVAR